MLRRVFNAKQKATTNQNIGQMPSKSKVDRVDRATYSHPSHAILRLHIFKLSKDITEADATEETQTLSTTILLN